jgi:magnesium transporter
MIRSFLLNAEGKFLSNVPSSELPAVLAEEGNFLWVDFFKATREEVRILSDVFKFHPLAIEDCTNVVHHPKIDNFEDYLFIVLHTPDYKKSPDKIRTTEIDFFLSKNYLVTFHEQPLKVINALQEKCEKGAESIMGKGTDFLMYQIVDLIMESYMPILDRADERIESCINRILENPSADVLNEIFSLKRGLLYLRRIIGPQRDTINRLTREEFHHIMPRTRIYFRDVYDRLIRIFDLIETYRDVIVGAQDSYLSAVSQKTNEVIRILAVVSTLIMPPTLIASIYGMNFKFMPELDWKLGYLLSIGLMVMSVVIMIYIMKKKKWF